MAKYYLEHFSQGDKTNPKFDILINEIHQTHYRQVSKRETLKFISDNFSVDFAAILFADYLLKHESNKRFQSHFDDVLSKIKYQLKSENLYYCADYSNYFFLFVPGWFYKSDPWTGAALARQRRIVNQLGIDHSLVEIDENATIEENAKVVAESIIQYGQAAKKTILVSVSKASAEVALAIGQLLDSEQTRGIAAWINIGGLLRGTPVADSAMRWPKRWLAKTYFLFKGWDFASVVSMTTQRSRVRWEQLKIPRHMLTINYIGIPLSGDVTVLARDRYMKMRKHGPNDGLTLIADAIAPNSVTLAQMGLDHFFLDPEIDIKAMALIRTLIHYLGACRT
ncbi:MAG: hypothetical protein ABFS45_12535 [Pseudomonadota bacterium]